MNKTTISGLAFFLISVVGIHAQSVGVNHPATDALGRRLPAYEEVGALQTNKVVAMFYWTWHAGHSIHNKACDLSKIITDPAMVNDYHHPNWQRFSNQGTFFWTEPLFGFYDGKDKWVIRKQLEMLGAAGVDVLFYDATNGNMTWKDGYETVGQVMAEARADGVKVPQFAFMLNFGPIETTAEALVQLYDELYKPGNYSDSWFMWQGKPVIMAYPEAMDLATLPAGMKAKADEIKTFFTFRPGQPAYEGGPTRNDQWGWLENAPQNGYVKKTSGGYEFMTVGVSQNWSEQTHALSAMNGPKIHGRSYTKADGFDKLSKDSYLYGYNFQEQWDRALKVDPDILFITGWNEWVMGRFETWMGVENAFPDQFDKEHSRDIEPMKGGCGDNYYYQMIANIRKFKGLEKPEAASPRKTVLIDGDFSDWADVTPEFKASKGNILHRDGYGYVDPNGSAGEHLHYVDNSGRNDVIAAKVTCDENFAYFYVKTAAALTSFTDAHWMQLLINVDRDRQTGWEGYDFMVDRYAADGRATLGKSSGDWSWPVAAKVAFKMTGAEMEIAIPRTFLNPSGRLRLDMEFKWVDNYTQSGDIMDFYTSGDAAPIGRFNYRYHEK